MHFALVFYPMTGRALIDKIRRKYDPTADLIQPHVTVLFPVPERIGEEGLVAHIRSVLKDYAPFEVCLGGFRKSADHWLFLTLHKGNERVKDLHRSLYTGLLAEFGRDDLTYVPHLGLGLFLKKDSRYDWTDPQESDFDAEMYETALREAEALGIGGRCIVETLHLVDIPDALLEWTRGKRPRFPADAKIVEVRQFRLAGRRT